MAMSQQLNTDAMNPTAHKYTAHQIALLYVSGAHCMKLRLHQLTRNLSCLYVSLFPLVQTCVNQMGAPVAHYKKDIESHFKSIKSLQARLGIGQQGLTVELQQWSVMGRTSCKDMVGVLQNGIVLLRFDPVTY